MSADPARSLSAGFNLLDVKVLKIQLLNQSAARTSGIGLSEIPNEKNLIVQKGRGMKIRRWKFFLWIRIEMDRAIGVFNNDIVVDEKVPISPSSIHCHTGLSMRSA